MYYKNSHRAEFKSLFSSMTFLFPHSHTKNFEENSLISRIIKTIQDLTNKNRISCSNSIDFHGSMMHRDVDKQNKISKELHFSILPESTRTQIVTFKRLSNEGKRVGNK